MGKKNVVVHDGIAELIEKFDLSKNQEVLDLEQRAYASIHDAEVYQSAFTEDRTKVRKINKEWGVKIADLVKEIGQEIDIQWAKLEAERPNEYRMFQMDDQLHSKVHEEIKLLAIATVRAGKAKEFDRIVAKRQEKAALKVSMNENQTKADEAGAEARRLFHEADLKRAEYGFNPRIINTGKEVRAN